MDISSSESTYSDSAPAAVHDSYDIAEQMLGLLIKDLCDGVDHPEIWQAFPQFLAQITALPDAMQANLALLQSPQPIIRVAFAALLAMRQAIEGDPAGALNLLTNISSANSESPLVQGLVFHLQSLLAPENPKFDLSDKFCMRPFHEIDVLESGTHLCCASWLGLSVGNMSAADNWQEVWNSENAERIRASIHDGSYRHCNKTACPAIQTNQLPTRAAVADKSPQWRAVVEEKLTRLAIGPEKVNLAYDRTCNLSCPSCRVEKFAADSVLRERFDRLQERSILPMLKDAKTVFITGSGDPFASKNFRRLMERLTADEYPDLRFIMMTNGMLLTRREWERFPALHNRVQSLQISIDASTKPTHELLRRGARWEVMLDNLDFAAELLRDGQVEQFHLCYTVQTENYREMPDAVDLANRLDVTGIYFGRVTNWGTFSPEEYQAKAVFQNSHPQHADFLDSMRDPRLREKRVNIGNLIDFIPSHSELETADGRG
ncbi:radical SAM protein [Sphingomonas sp. 37zxx]|uniref:radical SAM protein n=1 Tax=Sphingomonas sp. 37zxx TaxID=1550073 RepID=UPI00053BE6B7|nr:radical SAM protein [Sphingomonas sp. 37zxx]